MTYIEAAKGDKREAASLFLEDFALLDTEQEAQNALLQFIKDIQAYDNEAEYRYRRDSHFDNHV